MSSESFLSRWSRRKQEVREAEQAEPAGPASPEPAESERAPEADALGEGQAGATPADGPAGDELGPDEIARLPSLDELTAETDLSLFLRKGVPEALRNAALRRMWSLDPTIRDFVSEAREYAYDWNVPGGVPGSGVLPPSEDVAAMAARIVGGGPALDPDSAGAAPSKDRPQPEIPQQAEMPTAPPAAAAQPDRSPSGIRGRPLAETAALSRPLRNQEDAGGVTQAGSIDEPGDAPSSARRHGGAMPL